MPLIRPRGFTLVEMLCVLAIIGILASLLLGPISRAYAKARRMEWEMNAPVLVERFQERMASHFGKAARYPAFTAEALAAAGLIDSNLREFLGSRKVQYFPFSSEDADQKVILTVEISRSRVLSLTKGSLKPPE